MDTYEVVPTSAQSADCQPVVLWETNERRLVFKPRLVENAKDRDACVNGDLVYQRKSTKDAWEDHNDIPLNRLHAGEGVKISLQAGEVLAMVRHLAALYRLHGSGGLPRRKIHLLKLDLADVDGDALKQLDIRKLVALSRRAGVDVVTQFLQWLSTQDNAAVALKYLESLGTDALSRLSTLAGVAALESAVAEWEKNIDNALEEFWQDLLSRHAFVLSQAFSFPVVIIKAKAYMGGKVLDNTGGHLADYLAANPATRNPVIIEIKTPTTPLLERRAYRGGVYAPSEELSGGVTQVLTYRHSLIADPRLTKGYEDQLEVFQPMCMVLIGNTAELVDEDRRRSFELARTNYRDVVVLTYDELFDRLRSLLSTLKGV